jgi:hypothetical protein
MREIRTSGSEGGGAGYSTGSSYPYRACAHKGRFPPPAPEIFFLMPFGGLGGAPRSRGAGT